MNLLLRTGRRRLEPSPTSADEVLRRFIPDVTHCCVSWNAWHICLLPFTVSASYDAFVLVLDLEGLFTPAETELVSQVFETGRILLPAAYFGD